MVYFILILFIRIRKYDQLSDFVSVVSDYLSPSAPYADPQLPSSWGVKTLLLLPEILILQ